MSVDHSEISLEKTIESYLINHGGYIKGDPSEFAREKALFPKTFIAFIKDTQPDKWEKLERMHGDQVEEKVIYRLTRELSQRGMLDVLRKGITDFGVKLTTAYFPPASGLNPEIQELYDKNRLTATRQVRYSTKNENSLDLVLSINGLPVATAELKNPSTGQTFQDAKKQYKEDRDPKEPIFQFKKRTLVHFALDTDEVYMTTKLAKGNTVFLPFNKGKDGGKGNPENPNGYRTAYLWEEIWEKDTWMKIVSRFMNLEVKKEEKDGKQITKENIIFPRYHQLEAVFNITNDAQKRGPGKNYLVQHSAGSGKSLTIGWLAHRLSNLHDDNNAPVFNSVIVITDRVVLDKQLQETIYQIDHQQGVVERIDRHSSQLKDALEKGKKIIITTLQKFPVILDEIKGLPERNYAVIVDEAHSSQTGKSARAVREVLSAETLEEAEQRQQDIEDEFDPEEEIIKSMKKQGKQENLSFFAFTATPKAKTLETFGHKDKEGKPVPFHLYPMRQAIEEGFILDVLKNYTTYKTYFKLAKRIEDDPNLDKKKAAKEVARFVSLHPHNLAQKTEVMIEHFRNVTMHKINGKAKAMLVTSSRFHALRYKFEFDRYLKENGYDDIKTLVAFSGTVQDPELDKEYTESEINQIRESELPQKFDTDGYRLLLVADKYQTGFDQPLLHTMYVDKKLTDVKAVQTLSRLNRPYPGKDDTFVLDFVNEADDIKKAFQPFYEQTTVEETTDPNLLYDLKYKLDDFQVYWQTEIDNFCKVFFKPPEKQNKDKDAAMLNSYVDPAVDRFKNKPKEEQEEFHKTLTSFIRTYAFLLQIIPFQDQELHKLDAYGRFLLTKLPSQRNHEDTVELNNEIDLEYYRLEKTGDHSVVLEEQGEYGVRGTTHAGTGQNKDKEDEKAPLSEIIEIINERFGTDFTENDWLFFEQIKNDMLEDEELEKHARNNRKDNFYYAFKDHFDKKTIKRRTQNMELFAMLMDNEEFKEKVMDFYMNEVFKEFKNKASS
ncbi:type I restriction endonuclease subunit R [Natranaerobius thermophilus]|uniref:Helicase ATP-binding domain-containing protein n=1 Tax=Natranaerobius thermophilus (strain ATCC BAA-1301 / DSM 18059 / JW/NM-WN-LF) TaxID=457570 RepID=B2A7T2_NATTJ|nr:DEAD/DEAH box helicase family protein [Natranaerobius thermophilus]ACB84384.1 protein of unknown function DUF450 [Natranaerobius thermophilus JW/NM-WN-LF]